jgi:hypothetical protein
MALKSLSDVRDILEREWIDHKLIDPKIDVPSSSTRVDVRTERS